MIPGLDQLPSFFSLFAEEHFQPAKASPKGIGGPVHPARVMEYLSTIWWGK